MPLRNQRKKPWCKLGFTTVQEAEESQQCPEITQLRIVGREDFSPCLLEILARQTYLNCRSCHIQFTGIASHQMDPLGNAGQTRLNSDAKIADEGRPQGGGGHPQGAPLPIVFSGRYALGGRPQGAPLPIVFSGRYALGRAPTRGAPTDCLLWALCPEKGAHKGRPYRLSSLGVMPWGGRPQGAPLPIVFFRRYALGRAPTRGPYQLSLGVMPWGGHPQGAPLIVFFRRYALGRAPTRGAPTNCLFSALCPGEGTHKGRPYQLSFFGVMPWGGHPQGAPLPIVFFRRYALGRAPTRGAPTNCLFSALCPGEGAHKGRPYQLSFFGVMPWGGHPQGAPLPDSGSLTWVCPKLMQLPCWATL